MIPLKETVEKMTSLLNKNVWLKENNLSRTEAEHILLHVHSDSLSRFELYSSQIQIKASSYEKAIQLAKRRSDGTPLQYVLGEAFFGENRYFVQPGVFLPRPETEVLVQVVQKECNDPSLGFELGIGSGVISIELLQKFANLRIVATEISPIALKTAEMNRKRLLKNPSSLHLLKGEDPLAVLAPLRGQLQADFLVSNPPYLSSHDLIQPEVLEFEPSSALFAKGEDPSYFYRKIAEGASTILKPDGKVFLEIPHERAKHILEIFESNHWHSELRKDLTGRDRILIARGLDGQA